MLAYQRVHTRWIKPWPFHPRSLEVTDPKKGHCLKSPKCWATAKGKPLPPTVGPFFATASPSCVGLDAPRQSFSQGVSVKGKHLRKTHLKKHKCVFLYQILQQNLHLANKEKPKTLEDTEFHLPKSRKWRCQNIPIWNQVPKMSVFSGRFGTESIKPPKPAFTTI